MRIQGRCRHRTRVKQMRTDRLQGLAGAGIRTGERALDAHILEDVQDLPTQGIACLGRTSVDVKVGIAQMRGLMRQIAPGDRQQCRIAGQGWHDDGLTIGQGLMAADADSDAELSSQRRRDDRHGPVQGG